jgi:acetyltransferase-like isoleucine patch superfamily enzyme
MNWRLKLKIFFSLSRRSRETRNTASPVNLKLFFIQYILGFNKTAYWPVHHSSTVSGAQYIYTGKGTAPGLSHGCYIFANENAPVFIGDYTIVAPNVGIAGYNHNAYDYRMYEASQPLRIGNYCWLGMNSVILPGVCLGDHTIVAAGSVVTAGFPEGYVIIGGNPARVLKTLDPSQCVNYANSFEYRGYLTPEEFNINKDSIVSSKHFPL